ncbi:ARL8, ARF-like ras superfamily GTPase [Tribonema minus]|uniref:ARL8, ARF-like ras superfamily GTPase n=1 Tax=Tribonema minus TaxID=303371 RepID=A0A836CK42_9STRA|nr:ARL8, ARF-like ras superfamily GTPase [Tribonema minus]
MGAMLQRMLDYFWTTKQLEVVLVGLENSGKTTLLNVLAGGQDMETVPTIGLNVQMVRRGGVCLKCWDIGGQAEYRREWRRYAMGCDVIMYVVDSAAPARLASAKRELHRLLEDRQLSSTPLLVLANKIDLQPHVGEADLIKELNMDYIMDSPWLIIPISALRRVNIDQVLNWLTKQSRERS